MNVTETIKAIHVLAALRHFETPASQIQIVFGPYDASDDTPVRGPTEVAETCRWSAQVRLGGGHWGHSVGVGATPEEAAQSLLKGYVDAHAAVDERRASAFDRLPELRDFRPRSA